MVRVVFIVMAIMPVLLMAAEVQKPVKPAVDYGSMIKDLEARVVKDLAAMKGLITTKAPKGADKETTAAIEDARRLAQSSMSRFNALENKVEMQINSIAKDLREMVQVSSSGSNDVVTNNVNVLKADLQFEKDKTKNLEIRLHNVENELKQLNTKLDELKASQGSFSGAGSWTEWYNSKLATTKENAAKISEKAKKHNANLHASWTKFYDQYLVHVGPFLSNLYEKFLLWADAVHKRWRPVLEQAVKDIKIKIMENEHLRTTGIDTFVTVESLFGTAVVLATILLRAMCCLVCTRKAPVKSTGSSKKKVL